MRDNFSDRSHRQNILDNADQTEWHALKHGASSIEQGVYDEQIADRLEDFSAEGALEGGNRNLEWADRDLEIDTAVGSIHSAIEYRSSVLGSAYPFTVDGGQLVYQGSKTCAYEFFLLLTRIDLQKQYNCPRLFEYICQRLVQCYLGTGSKSAHTGWPRFSGASFQKALSGLSGDKSEWVWGPSANLSNPPNTRHMKDGGLDFVVWKPHLDNRPGHLFILGQCAAGKNWENKLDDLNIKKLEQWFNPMTWVPPTRAFCTPFHITDGHLQQASTAENLVFDRLRLVLLAEYSPILCDVWSLCDMVRWLRT